MRRAIVDLDLSPGLRGGVSSRHRCARAKPELVPGYMYCKAGKSRQAVLKLRRAVIISVTTWDVRVDLRVSKTGMRRIPVTLAVLASASGFAPGATSPRRAMARPDTTPNPSIRPADNEPTAAVAARVESKATSKSTKMTLKLYCMARDPTLVSQ